MGSFGNRWLYGLITAAESAGGVVNRRIAVFEKGCNDKCSDVTFLINYFFLETPDT